VGGKTTVRLLNHKWSEIYSYGTKINAQDLPLEKDVILMVTRSEGQLLHRMVRELEKIGRTDVHVLYVSQRVVRYTRDLLARWRGRMCNYGESFHGGVIPSSGFMGTYIMLHLCHHTTLYGFHYNHTENKMFHSSNNTGDGLPYSYFGSGGRFDARHSPETEHSFLQKLATTGEIQICERRIEPDTPPEPRPEVTLEDYAEDEDSDERMKQWREREKRRRYREEEVQEYNHRCGHEDNPIQRMNDQEHITTILATGEKETKEREIEIHPEVAPATEAGGERGTERRRDT